MGNQVFLALLDTGSSVSLMGDPAVVAAQATGAGLKRETHSFRLATGWSTTTQSIRCRIRWSGGCRKQRFIHMPGLCRDIILGRDFLIAAGLSIHVALGGWTLGTEIQELVRFGKSSEVPPVALSEEVYSLEELFAVPREVETCPEEAMVRGTPGEKAEGDRRIVTVLNDYKDTFTVRPGCTSLIQHSIDTGDSRPVRCKMRPVNAEKRAIIDECIKDLLDQDLIEPSTSSWASAPVLVAKKTGGYRLAVDYRPLNARTDVPVHPMPRTDWILAQLGKARWFTSLDLSQGFFQIPVATRDIPKTAFLCHQGTFQFKRMPFGVAGGPATFQALMDKVLDGVKHRYCMAFLDDVLVFSESFEDHVVHLRDVLHRIAEAGLTINPSKVQLCKQSLKFLGHVISPGKCQPDPEKVRAVEEYPTPTSVKQLQAFLGLVGYYRTFIPRFSDIAKPLTTLLKKNAPWRWDQPQRGAFKSLKSWLTEEAVVALPDLNRPFIIETDASGIGIAAVLLQEKDGHLRPVSFISRTLTEAESNYTVQEWECLAVVWALDKFRPYIEFAHFEVHCDHASLSWMFHTEQTSSRVKRWVLRLQGFKCTVKHRRGKANIPADALSRCPVSAPEPPSPSTAEDWFPIEVSEPVPSIRFEEVAASESVDISLLRDGKGLAAEQRKDELLRTVIDFIENNSLPSDIRESRRVQDLAADSEIDDTGLLLYVSQSNKVPWLPLQLRSLVLQVEHDHPLSAHAGYFKTLRRTERRFHWLGMRADVSRYVRACKTCQAFKPRRQKPKGLMDSSWATGPMEHLSVDLIGPLPATAKQNKYILVILDKFTKFIELCPLRTPTSRAIVERMVDIFCRHGVPQSISSDNGQPFVSRLWKGVLKHWGIAERHTVPYRPAGQTVERHNATVKQAIAAYCGTHRDWDRRLPEVAFAMRTSESVVTGYTPAFLCYGRELRTPWEFRPQEHSKPQPSTSHVFTAELSQHLKDALDFARDHQRKAQETQQRHYNRRRQQCEFAVGDFVLRDSHTLSNASRGITAKLAPRRSGPFAIAARVGENVYRLKDPTTGRRCGLANVDQLVRYYDS